MSVTAGLPEYNDQYILANYMICKIYNMDNIMLCSIPAQADIMVNSIFVMELRNHQEESQVV